MKLADVAQRANTQVAAYQEDPAPVAAELEQVERRLQRVGERRQHPLLVSLRGGAPRPRARLPELLGEGPEEPNPARQRQQLAPVRVPELPPARRRRLHGRRHPVRSGGGPAVPDAAGHGVATWCRVNRDGADRVAASRQQLGGKSS